MNEILSTLNTTGIVVLNNCICAEELTRLTTIYTNSLETIKLDKHNLQWKQIQLKNPNNPLKYIGQSLYQDNFIADFQDTQIVNMNNSRYDFSYNLENILLNAPLVMDVVKNVLKYDYNYYCGGLPVLGNFNKDGNWHRDAYSLFDNENIDLVLEPFYLTALIPLHDILENDITTEFILGSHKLHLAENGIIDKESLNSWCKKKEKTGEIFRLNCKAGDVCLFNGFTIHRGRGSILAKTEPRHLMYAVFKKNWYNDEPENNYELIDNKNAIKDFSLS